jgi:protein-L-isoaspartate(D-aspartate) O-methyltransferase
MAIGDQPELLRAQLVAEVRAAGYLTSAAAQAAMTVVPRHHFLPEVAIAHAYANQPVTTKCDANGNLLSSASQPSIVAAMLEQLEVQAGNRVLEIGAGTGYNAALLRELVGQHGAVTTVDIDPQLADRARGALITTGYGDVQVVAGDGTFGYQPNAPYDRIIVTAGAWDLPPAWWRQLTEGGRLVVPLRWRGQTRSIAFDHHGSFMVSLSVNLCGFIPMRGGDGEGVLPLADGSVSIHYDEDQPIATDRIARVLEQPRHEAWSGVSVDSRGSFDGLWLWLTTVEPGTCRLASEASAVDSGLVNPALPARSPALIEGASLAYLAVRPKPDARSRLAHMYELGVVGHGSRDLVQRFADNIRAWDADRGNIPVITVYLTSAPDQPAPREPAIQKVHTCMTFGGSG